MKAKILKQQIISVILTIGLGISLYYTKQSTDWKQAFFLFLSAFLSIGLFISYIYTKDMKEDNGFIVSESSDREMENYKFDYEAYNKIIKDYAFRIENNKRILNCFPEFHCDQPNISISKDFLSKNIEDDQKILGEAITRLSELKWPERRC